MLILNAPVPLWPPAPATTPDYSGTLHSGKRRNLWRRTRRNIASEKPDPTGLLLRAIPEEMPPTPAGVPHFDFLPILKRQVFILPRHAFTPLIDIFRASWYKKINAEELSRPALGASCSFAFNITTYAAKNL